MVISRSSIPQQISKRKKKKRKNKKRKKNKWQHLIQQNLI